MYNKCWIIDVLHNSRKLSFRPLELKLTMFYCNSFKSIAGLSFYTNASQESVTISYSQNILFLVLPHWLTNRLSRLSNRTEHSTWQTSSHIPIIYIPKTQSHIILSQHSSISVLRMSLSFLKQRTFYTCSILIYTQAQVSMTL
jgi:hypothetical protein